MHPTLFHLGERVVGTYGVLVALGYLVGALWLWSQRERMHLTFWQFWLLCYCILSGAVIGAKAGFFLVEWRDFLADPWGWLRAWRSGWVYWSGFAGTMAAGLVYQKIFNACFEPRKRYLPPADYFAAALAIGHAIGRVGCFAQGCCYGRLTELPWGVAFLRPDSSVPAALLGLPLHPVQLYEAAGELAIGLFLIAWALPRIRAGRLRYGTAFFGYIGAYSILRFVTELFRADERGVFLSDWLSPSQWWSLGGLVFAASAIWLNGAKERDPSGRSFYLEHHARI
ncbi:MAG: prolipoprotein diacylglyceryl transferase [Elusimicrobia bacterium]|nr:prolipoprotein diacylglyceryl transferase [Elusimicrobiota bacterium]